MRFRYAVGITFLALQVASIIYARFIPERFFCWAPYDEHSHFEVKVKIGDKSLSSYEIKNRYRYTALGWEPRAIHNVFNLIEQYEATYGKQDDAEVSVIYSTNGHDECIWRLPQN